MTEAAASDPVHEFIAEAIADHPVILFMKGEPDQPRCNFSKAVVDILDQIGVDFVGVDVLQSDALRQGVKAFSDWPTIPQLYVKGEFVGGCDIVREMYATGELQDFLQAQGVVEA